MHWKRPEHVPYPSVWAEFLGNVHADAPPLKYKIQDLPEELFQDAITHMTRYFLVRENICSTSGFIDNDVAVKELHELWKQVVHQRMALVALVTDENGKERIAGVNMTFIIQKKDRDEEHVFMGEPMRRAWNLLEELEAEVDVFEKYNVDSCMTALGLSVSPEFHGDNVGYRLLMARTQLCKATGIKLTETVFTGSASQYLAKKSNFQILAETTYETYQQNGRIAYPKLKGKCLFMIKEITEDTDN